jgi:hypothetical protein
MDDFCGFDELGADPLYGPGSSSGTYYTDKATITAVQKKLKSLGYFHGTVDGVYGSVTNAAIKNYSGKDGPPDDALLQKLGLSKEIAFTDAEADSMIVKAKTATTPAQVQIVIAEVEKRAANASPEVKAKLAEAKKAAAGASTPAELEAAKAKAETAITTASSWWQQPAWVGGWERWKVALAAGGGGAGLLTVLVALLSGGKVASVKR